jgi:arylsulfatase A-like enzyme
MWDATPMPIPLDAYIDVWHGEVAARWIHDYQRDEPFFLFLGFPGPHDPWDAPQAAVAPYLDRDIAMPASTQRPDIDGAGTYGRLLKAFLDLSDTATMTDDAIRSMRRAYCADVSVIDAAIGRVVAALEATGRFDDTWIIYTSDHGEMAGDHGLMSKCVLYDPAVRVPLIVRPPGGCAPRVVDAAVEHLDVPATVREIASAAAIPNSEGRTLLGYVAGDDPAPRQVSISENWGFAAFTTDHHTLVVDEDALQPCQLFDLAADPTEDVNRVADPECKPVVEEFMEAYVRPFLATAPARPHRSPFTG